VQTHISSWRIKNWKEMSKIEITGRRPLRERRSTLGCSTVSEEEEEEEEGRGGRGEEIGEEEEQKQEEEDEEEKKKNKKVTA
jgi:hypothetical protein